VVRLRDLHEAGQRGADALECPVFADKPFVQPIPAQQRKVTLVSSAGLIRRGDQPFRGGDTGYRTFTDDDDNADVLVSHISVNFDRTAAVRNIESVFPRTALREVAAEGHIGASADSHYSFLGSSDPVALEAEAKVLAGVLQQDKVNTVVLLPV